MIRLGLRPNSSGGMSDPLRLLAPLPGTSDGLLLPTGVDSLITSIFGASGAFISGVLISGVLISGNLGWKRSNVRVSPIPKHLSSSQENTENKRVNKRERRDFSLFPSPMKIYLFLLFIVVEHRLGWRDKLTDHGKAPSPRLGRKSMTDHLPVSYLPADQAFLASLSSTPLLMRVWT